MAASRLRLCTAGSVDDGKSTLIGRLLLDTRSLFEDHVLAVASASRRRSATGALDLSLFTDGLRAEREQGITIDVAYRYFSTPRRRYILADTPGHTVYTRNMATGASTADVAILLADAERGLRPQSFVHARIARLMGVSSFVLAVNKMDRVEYDEDAFAGIVRGFEAECAGVPVQAIPVSALHGDNVVVRSGRMPWYQGPSLIEHLDSVPEPETPDARFRFAVQIVLRHEGVRALAGRIASGLVRVGRVIAVWPSGATARVSRIITMDGPLQEARAGQSVAIVLDGDLDVARGDVLADAAPWIGRRFEATLVWMDERPAEPRRLYLMKLGTRTVWVDVSRQVGLNEIADVELSTSAPVVADAYTVNRSTGSLILIDPETRFTCAAGLIRGPVAERGSSTGGLVAAGAIARAAREAQSDSEAAAAVHRALEEWLK
jgi:sulfate adenylyltransferase subunit 1